MPNSFSRLADADVKIGSQRQERKSGLKCSLMEIAENPSDDSVLVAAVASRSMVTAFHLAPHQPVDFEVL
jgi:hypothetical protein